MRYRKKPVVIDAVQWKGDNARELEDVFGEWFEDDVDDVPVGKPIVIETLEGDMCCDLYDWVIRGVKGEFYPCKPDIFEATYEPVA